MKPAPRNGDTKQCTLCLKFKLLDLFHRDATVKDGRRSRCKVCLSIRGKIYRERPEVHARIQAYSRSEYRKARYRENLKVNREKINKYHREQRETILGRLKQAIYRLRYDIKKAKTLANRARLEKTYKLTLQEIARHQAG